MKESAIPASRLRYRCDPDLFGVEDTRQIPPLTEIIGQDRALSAIRFGLEMKQKGYNLYLCGAEGVGKTSSIRILFEQIRKTLPVPNDRCYVHNFKEPEAPIHLSFKAGEGRRFQKDIAQLIDDLLDRVPRLFAAEKHKGTARRLFHELRELEARRFDHLDAKIRAEGFTLVRLPGSDTPQILPLLDGMPVSIEHFDELCLNGSVSREQIRHLEQVYPQVREALDDVLEELRERRERIEEELASLARTLIRPELAERIAGFKARYPDPKVARYLDALEADILEHLDLFRREVPAEEEDGETEPSLPWQKREECLRNYRVNLIVDNGELDGAPVIFDTHPTHEGLFGTIEHTIDRSGAQFTDFTRIRAGTLLKADGGFLILNVNDLLKENLYDALRNTLRYMKLEIVDAPTAPATFVNVYLKPEPIDLCVKVILIGDYEHFEELALIDQDFEKVFKVKAEFDDEIVVSKENLVHYAAFVSKICQEEGLRPFHKSALAAIVEYGVRVTSDQRKITSRFRLIADLIRESDYWAAKTGNGRCVMREDVERAIRMREERFGLLAQKMREEIVNGVVHIETSGRRKGQVNGLTLLGSGPYAFGLPVRVTAAVSFGTEGIINIEREVELSGSSHDKGVMILEGFLRNKYPIPAPISISASICFEQSYSFIDGDSASSTEVFALLSALSEIPVRQGIAVTGAIDQFGNMHPVGGVNEKIEAFFDLCAHRGLDGEQGVIVPARNLDNLMLKAEVVEAVAAKRFTIWAVHDIDEGLEILTGLPAGVLSEELSDPVVAIHGRVYRRLLDMAQRMMRYA